MEKINNIVITTFLIFSLNMYGGTHTHTNRDGDTCSHTTSGGGNYMEIGGRSECPRGDSYRGNTHSSSRGNSSGDHGGNGSSLSNSSSSSSNYLSSSSNVLNLDIDSIVKYILDSGPNYKIADDCIYLGFAGATCTKQQIHQATRAMNNLNENSSGIMIRGALENALAVGIPYACAAEHINRKVCTTKKVTQTTTLNSAIQEEIKRQEEQKYQEEMKSLLNEGKQSCERATQQLQVFDQCIARQKAVVKGLEAQQQKLLAIGRELDQEQERFEQAMDEYDRKLADDVVRLEQEIESLNSNNVLFELHGS